MDLLFCLGFGEDMKLNNMRADRTNVARQWRRFRGN
jgi:hypothetical protein